jgi:hypothetical protein
MSRKKHIDSQDIATERFAPDLSGEYAKMFETLVTRLGKSLPLNRQEFLLKEIELFKARGDNNLDAIKYLACLNILYDLSLQGWIFDIDKNCLYLRMESDNIADKDHIKYRLHSETDAQFKVKSVRYFIKSMERERLYQGRLVSIKALIGDPEALITKIRNKEEVCKPYIELVSGNRDKYTGLKLADIWRYFRYTWSIPYKTMPGRNMYYLVRDAGQDNHPIIGIFALGNSVLNLTVRDDKIGWTVEAIRNSLERKSETDHYEQKVSDTEKTIKVSNKHFIETEDAYHARVSCYSEKVLTQLIKNVDIALADIYIGDLNCDEQIANPTQDFINLLFTKSEDLRLRSLNNKNAKNPDWRQEACSVLFTRKRTAELAKLLESKLAFQSVKGTTAEERLRSLLSNDSGRKAITRSLLANRKCKIGSNMMEIIVCGAVPPYNELLGGKLVSMLSCSPIVIKGYTERYQNQVSEIASRMKGERVIRDSRLAFLGTTSLYSSGSSQYNRIRVPFKDGFNLEFRKMGITEGFGTVYFSSETTTALSRMLEIIDGGKRISHVFGEGTSPRFRLINRGLTLLGIKAASFLKHYSPRIVYSIELATNTNEFLLGFTDELHYNFHVDNEEDISNRTQEIIDYWYERWLKTRLGSVNIEERLDAFIADKLLLSNRL